MISAITRSVKKQQDTTTAMATNGVPHFRSGQDPEVFFYKLETYAAANNKDIDTMYKNLAMYLDDQVTRWLMDQPQAVLTDSTKLKAVIKARYSSQEKGTSMQCLRNRTQQEGEDTEDFIMEMHRLCKDCDMSEKTATSFIMESLLPSVQFAMKMKSPKTVSEMINVARTVPVATLLNNNGSSRRLEDKIDVLQATFEAKIAALSNQPQRQQQQRRFNNHRQLQRPNQQRHHRQQRNQPHQGQMDPCTRCGKSHQRFNCPAYGPKCHKCNGSNHFQSMCRTKSQ